MSSLALKVPNAETSEAATGSDQVAGESHGAGNPFLLPLRRESVPVKRRGQVVSFKTSYSGLIHVGSPKPQEFRVVFDTGSGHVVLPAKECQSDSCLVHRRYSMKASKTAKAINMDGSPVSPGDVCDQVTVGFGTGQVTGEFVRERVCLGPAPPKARKGAKTQTLEQKAGPCNQMHVIVAVEMSSQPFRSFDFDGIIGMGLSSLALSANFSFFQMAARDSNQTDLSQFGVYLTEGDDGEDSEIAIGGYNLQRMIRPLSWAPVFQPELGFWQVAITAIRIDGVPLEACKQGCRGIVDTGTSHWGIPSPHDATVTDLLSTPAGDLLDCRLAHAPVVEIEISGFNLTLHPQNYMRRLPLRDGVTVGSKRGIAGPSKSEASTASDRNASAPKAVAKAKESKDDEGEAEVVRRCKPKVVGVNLPAPMGPDMFIFGEPLLHRYYTVFDAKTPKVGFALASNRMNKDGPDLGEQSRGSLPEEVDILL